jgi:hypothetical protein
MVVGFDYTVSSSKLESYHVDDSIPDAKRQQFTKLIQSYEDVFSSSDTYIRHTSIVEQKIELTDEVPFKQRCREIPPNMYMEIKNNLQQLLDAGLIRKFKSLWSSNEVLCKKKDKYLRMCIYYRGLYNRTKKDSYAMPRRDEILEALSNDQFFTILDMKVGIIKLKFMRSTKSGKHSQLVL